VLTSVLRTSRDHLTEFVGAQKHRDTTSIVQWVALFECSPDLISVRRTAVKGNGKKRQSSKEAGQDMLPNPSSAFARIDALAVSSLSNESLARYYAYKHTLLDLEQDHDAVISTLSIYVWDLFEGRSFRDRH
jgi:thiazole synthase ThiGH ThiG subunit